jgi:hypothetical protein
MLNTHCCGVAGSHEKCITVDVEAMPYKVTT